VRNTQSLELVRALAAAGVPIVAGTDKAVPAHSLHRELKLYVQAGISPMDVIRLATSGSARVMGMDRDSGTIERGKRADLILVDGNPLLNFADLRKISRVIANGRVYDPARLWQSAGFRP
jgi:imidazolonepropionase-like amidohydrolase